MIASSILSIWFKVLSKKLLESLRCEIQKHSELLVKLFPDRIYEYTDNDLSSLWRDTNIRYISVCKVKAKQFGFRFSEKALNILEEKLKKKLGAKAIGSLIIIEEYRNYKFSTLEFISKIKSELAKDSRDIPLKWEELSLILTGTNSIESLYSHELNPNSKRFRSDFKFSKERQQQFKDSIVQVMEDKGYYDWVSARIKK